MIIHAKPEHGSSTDGLMPPPVTENTGTSSHGVRNMVNARRLDSTRLEPQQLHTVMIMPMVTRMAMIRLLHMMLFLLVLVIRITVTTVAMAGLVQPV